MPLTVTQRLGRPLEMRSAQATGSLGALPFSSGVSHNAIVLFIKLRSRCRFGCVAGSRQYGPPGLLTSPGAQACGASEGNQMKRVMLLVVMLRTRSPLWKKNSFSFLIGPPTVQPY